MHQSQTNSRGQVGRALFIALLVATLACATLSCATPPARAQAPAPAHPLWLEPKGLNIVDLVGRVPEEDLQGSIIQYASGFGILRYESGRRDGDRVTVVAKAFTRIYRVGSWHGTLFGCLGQPAFFDQMASTAPATLLTVEANGRDVTHEVASVAYMAGGQVQPALSVEAASALHRSRYAKTAGRPDFTQRGEIALPANSGCELVISDRDYPELTLTFRADVPEALDVDVLGSETHTFHSYLGPGYAGHLCSLVDQLYAAGYTFRSEKFDLRPPEGADYLFMNYPAASVDPYSEFPAENAGRPSSGTYRVSSLRGLSVDHVNAMGLPLYGQWQDIDEDATTWLRYSNQPWQIGAPEYFVPAGVAYDPCMTEGECPEELLAKVYAAPMTMKVLYLRVGRAGQEPGDYERIPVQIPGEDEGDPPPLCARAARSNALYLPWVALPDTAPQEPPGCSPHGGCGWFTADGRMVDYEPYPG